MNYFEAMCFKGKIHIFMYLQLLGVSDHHPQLLQILWKINYIWIIEQDTLG